MSRLETGDGLVLDLSETPLPVEGLRRVAEEIEVRRLFCE